MKIPKTAENTSKYKRGKYIYEACNILLTKKYTPKLTIANLGVFKIILSTD